MNRELSAPTNRRGSELYPALFDRFVQFEVQARERFGYRLNIAQGFRTADHQDDLYALGRTKPGKTVTNARGYQSWHCYGLAFDISVRGQYPYHEDLELSAANDLFDHYGRLGEYLGLRWGGRFGDKPHFELPVPGFTTDQAYSLFSQGGLAAVWKECDFLLKETIQNGMVEQS